MLDDPIPDVVTAMHPRQKAALCRVPFAVWLLEKYYETVCLMDADVWVARVELPLPLEEGADVVVQEGERNARGDADFDTSVVLFGRKALPALRRTITSCQYERDENDDWRPTAYLTRPGSGVQEWGDQAYLQAELEKARDRQEMVLVHTSSLTCTDPDAWDPDLNVPFWHLRISDQWVDVVDDCAYESAADHPVLGTIKRKLLAAFGESVLCYVEE